MSSERGPVGIPEELTSGSALGAEAILDLGGHVVDVDRRPFDSSSEVALENGVDERAAIGRRDGVDLTRIFESVQVEHMAEEVAERTGRPLLQRCGRPWMLEVVRELRPTTDGTRPRAELARDPRLRGGEPALETGRVHDRQLVELAGAAARAGEQFTYVELGRRSRVRRRRPATTRTTAGRRTTSTPASSSRKRVDAFGVDLLAEEHGALIENEGRRLARALPAGIGHGKGERARRSDAITASASRLLFRGAVPRRAPAWLRPGRGDRDRAGADRPPGAVGTCPRRTRERSPRRDPRRQPRPGFRRRRRGRSGPLAPRRATTRVRRPAGTSRDRETRRVGRASAKPSSRSRTAARERCSALGPTSGRGIASEIRPHELLCPPAEGGPRSAITGIGVDGEPIDERVQRIDLDDAPSRPVGRTHARELLTRRSSSGNVGSSAASAVARDPLDGAVAGRSEALPPLLETAHDTRVARDAIPSIGPGSPTCRISQRRAAQQPHELVASMAVDRPREQSEQRAAR